jgi:hypothetical protein
MLNDGQRARHERETRLYLSLGMASNCRELEGSLSWLNHRFRLTHLLSMSTDLLVYEVLKVIM